MNTGAVTKVVRGGIWLYLSSVTNSVGGFLYWLVISRLAGSEVLGLTSATVGFSILVRSIISLGIGAGLQHFLGWCVGLGDRKCFSKYFWTGLNISLGLYSTVGASLILLGQLGFGFLGFSPEMLRLAGVLVMLGVFGPIQSALLAVLRTDIVFASTVIGNILKFLVGIALVSAGWGFVGAVLGFMTLFVALAVIGAAYAVRYAGSWGTGFLGADTAKELLRGSVVSWLPNVVLIAGQWVGVLAVFGYGGGVETGHYYVAYAIANFVLGIGVMMVNLLLPVLSGLRSGREAAAGRVLRLSLAIVIPASAFIAAYPSLPLSLLGAEYLDASAILTILILSSVPLTIYFAVNSLVYSYRRYSDVLYLGLSQNVPRLVLYLTTVPELRGLGAALSFTIGAYTGLTHAALLAKKVGFRVNWAEIAKAIGVPASMMVVAYLISIPWPVALALTIASYLLYGRIGILRRDDVRDLAHALLGKELTARIYEKTRWLIDNLFT